MKTIMKFIAEKTRELNQTPLMDFIRNKDIDPRQRFAFTPIVVPWALGFSDLNKLVMRNTDESSLAKLKPADREIQEMINIHTQEDDHHWKFFMADVQTLGLNIPQDFSSVVKLLWSDDCARVRQLLYGLTGLITAATPTLRFVIVEAVEAAGNVSFKALTQAARDFEQATQKRLYYYGTTHLDLESGHLMGTHEIEKKLFAIKLTDDETVQAREAVEKVFTLMHGMFEDYLAYAKKHAPALPSHPAVTQAAVEQVAK